MSGRRPKWRTGKPASYRWLPDAELARRYDEGESTRALGRAFGVSGSTIRGHLNAYGVQLRPSGGPQGRANGSSHPGGPLHMNCKHLVSCDRSGAPYAIHRACWEAYHGPIPAGWLVHHINADPLGNRIENLACMSRSTHNRLHRLAEYAAVRAGRARRDNKPEIQEYAIKLGIISSQEEPCS